MKCLSCCHPFRILGTITLASCPGSYPSLWAYHALDPLMDLSSLLPGRFLAQFCGFCLQVMLNAPSFGVVLQRVAVGRHKV